MGDNTSNFQRVPLPVDSGYIDWSKNLAPIFQTYIDRKKYAEQRDDQQKLAMLQNFIQQGAYAAPSMVAGGGYNLTPLTTEEQLALKGKSPYAGMSDQSTALLNMIKAREIQDRLEASKRINNYFEQYLSQADPNQEGTMFVNMPGNIAQFGINYGSPAKKPGLLASFFGNKNKNSAMSNPTLRAAAMCKALGVPPTSENIAQIMSNPSFGIGGTDNSGE